MEISYLSYNCLEGIERTHYVFKHDEKGTPWLIRVTGNDLNTSPRKKASKEFIQSLNALIEQGDVFSYERVYEPAEAVCGGAIWELEVRCTNGPAVRSSGHAVMPPNSILESLELLLKSYL